MSLLVAIILGGLVGWIASAIMGRDEGVFASIVIGIIGSFIGSFVSSLFTGSDKSFLAFSWMGLFWSLIGSVILVAIMNAMSRPRHHTI
ncbi:MAG: transglycosylase [Candidatus Saccharibacteria bacterium]|nr:transglycosylase [Candidatus Saccharibacteria bacterium]